MQLLLEDYAAILVALDLLVIVGLLIFTRIKPWILFLGSSGALYLSNVLTLEGLLKGYTNPSLLVLMLLIMVAIPLERTSFMRRMTAYVIGSSASVSTLKLSVVVGFFSAFVNNTAVVSAMLGPLKRRANGSASKLLLPLSYASILGGTLTLIGTSTNLIVNGFVQQSGYGSLSFFDFTLVGLPVFISCVVLMALLAPRVLKQKTLAQQVSTQDYFVERRVQPNSRLIGRSVQDNGLRRLERIFLIEIIREHQVLAPVNPQERILSGDILVFTGDLSALDLLDDFDGLTSLDVFDKTVRDNLVEVIVSPTASLVGRTIKQVDFRSRYDAAVVAVRRGSERLQGGLGQLLLQAGDSLVLAVGDDFNRGRGIASDFIVVGGVESTKPLSKPKEWGVFASFAVIVALGATGFVPLIKGLLVLVMLLVAFNILSLEDIKARFPYQLMIVIGGALGLSQAMFSSGLADIISSWASVALSELSPIGALIGVFILTWLFTELVTNNAAAAIMFPLAMALSSHWGDNYLAFVMAVAFGASASFISPYGYQTNLMVYTAGNYRLSDYLKLGLPLLLVYSVVSLTAISVFFA